MKELPVRKHPRLKGYDYSRSGTYYITFCVKDRHNMLGKVVGRAALGAPFVELSEYGEIIRKEIEETRLHYNDVSIDNFVVMPNHIHLLITITGAAHNNAPEAAYNDAPGAVYNNAPRAAYNGAPGAAYNGAPRAARPTANVSIPRIVAILKRKTNKIYGFNMWQSSYHDHIIRNEADYQRIWQYIDENPAKWAEDCFYV